jgi:hypothetical protein
MIRPPAPPPQGIEKLEHRLVEGAAFEPCFDLVADGEILATLFYDDKPECAYASVELENEDGEPELVDGAEAGLDEDEVGWCLLWTDQPREVTVISRAPVTWADQALAGTWLLIQDRIDRDGLWQAATNHRLWEDPIDEDEADEPMDPKP